MKYALFFIAGWFSAVIAFEVSPALGNIVGMVSFVVLLIAFK